MEQKGTDRNAIAGRYAIRSRVETHGGSSLFTATRASDGQLVALREYVPVGTTLETALGTLTRIAAISSRSLADIVEVFVSDTGTLCVAHKLLEGESLLGREGRKGLLTAVETASLGVRILKGLDALHQRGLVHGALRPSRVFHQVAAPRGWHVRLLGAGVHSVTVDEARADSGLVSCSPPEWLNGAAWTPRSDVWCVAAMLYTAMSGRSAFEGPTAAAMARRITTGDATPLRLTRTDAPEDLEALLARCLARDPADRPGNASELIDRLLARYPERERTGSPRVVAADWTRGGFVGQAARPRDPHTGTVTRLVRERDASRRLLAWAAAALVLAMLVSVGLHLRTRRDARDRPPAVASRPMPVAPSAPVALVASAPIAARLPDPAPIAPVVLVTPHGPHATHTVASPPPPPLAAGLGALQFETVNACSLMLDGRVLGTTTRLYAPLSAGHHTLMCHADVATQRLSVDVTAGAVTRVDVNGAGLVRIETRTLDALRVP